MRTGSASMDCAKSWRGRAGVGGLHPISKMWADSREFWGLAGGERRALTRGWGNPRNTSSRSRDSDLRVSVACKHFTWPDDLDWYRPGTPGRRCRGHLGPARSSRRDHAVGDTPKLPSGRGAAPRRAGRRGSNRRTAVLPAGSRGPTSACRCYRRFLHPTYRHLPGGRWHVRPAPSTERDPANAVIDRAAVFARPAICAGAGS